MSFVCIYNPSADLLTYSNVVRTATRSSVPMKHSVSTWYGRTTLPLACNRKDSCELHLYNFNDSPKPKPDQNGADSSKTIISNMPPTADPLGALSFAAIDPAYPNTLLYAPDLRSQTQQCPSQDKAAVKVIVLATWLGGASASRIAVYCRGYQAAYPTASILLLRTVLSDITVKTFAALQTQLEPARNYLLSAFPPGGSQTEGGALLHMFSHGGCNTALQLSRLLRGSNTLEASFPIPLIGVVLDSCPGSSGFVKAYSGAVYSLPAVRIPGINLLGRACLFPVIGSISFLQAWGLLSSVEDLRRELNDFDTFGPTPRLYLHSKGDRLVAAEDVASHAAEIGARVPVVREVWEVAEHVTLPLEDSERYWSAVKSFVDVSTRTRGAKL